MFSGRWDSFWTVTGSCRMGMEPVGPWVAGKSRWIPAGALGGLGMAWGFSSRLPPGRACARPPRAGTALGRRPMRNTPLLRRDVTG